VSLAERAAKGSVLVVVTGTGSGPSRGVPRHADDGRRRSWAMWMPPPWRANSLVEASVPGGLFLDQAVLTQAGITGQVAQRARSPATTAPDGSPLMSDTFQGFFVSFGKYC